MERKIGRGKIRLKKGDIVDEKVDAIVNAANPSLMGGGGVDGAIHRAGGRRMMEECLEIIKKLPAGRLEPGEAVITPGGDLKAGYVIHTVGPVWRGGKEDEEERLRGAYRNSLRIAKENNFGEVSFPSISTGAYGYPAVLASRIALSAVSEFLKENAMTVNFVLFDDDTYKAYRNVLDALNV